jgi:integrase
MALTVKQVEHAKSGDRLGDGNGLWLFVAASGTKSWMFRFTSPVTRKAREMGLGPAADLKLAEAREAAQQARKLVLAGKDPIEERKHERAAMKVEAAKSVTFEKFAEKYIAAQKPGWRNPKHAQQWENTLKTYAYPVIGAMPVSDVTKGDVVKVLQPIWLTKKETAARLRGRIEVIIDAAKADDPPLFVGDNPALLGILKHNLPKQKRKRSVKHHPALPQAEMPKFWKSLASDTSDAAHMLRWVILTACRFGEVRHMNPNEVKGDIWTIPAGRIKGEQEHKVPLVPQAVALLPLRLVSDVSLTKCIRRHTDWPASTHGMRSTFRNWIRDTGRDETLGELALAHTVGNETERAYARSDAFDRRRKLMQEWSEYCGGSKRPAPLARSRSARS